MREHTLRVLEFYQFLSVLKEYTCSEVGQAYCLALRPLQSREDIEILYQEVAEAILVLQNIGEPPLTGFYDLRPLLQECRPEGTILSPENLLKVRKTLGVAAKIKEFLAMAGPKYPCLKRWMEKIPSLLNVYEALCKALGERGEILDSASPDLEYLRREIIILRGRIRKKLESLWGQENLKNIFQEFIITLRNERYVLAIKSEFKNYLPGIIHDQSHSGATFYIEPFSTVEENNELNLLLKKEDEEERRILRSLTDLVREKGREIYQTIQILGYLDLLFAKGKYALATKSIIPKINHDGELCLKEARHPLIPSQYVVPIHLELKKGKNTLIISGANAGGKTVALKTLGLLTILGQCAIPIPVAEGSKIAVFNHVFAEIGDEQSISNNLSTFSAWIQTICQVLQEADENSLVLLDEVGGGTDPNEGAALTMALIDELRKRGTKTVVTTHLQLLKAYGNAHSDVINVSVEFNTETHQPTYKLIYGRPGESYAFPMAQRWGLPVELVERAKGYIGEGDRKIGQLLQNLEKKEQEAEAKRWEYEQLVQKQERINQETKIFLEQLKNEKKVLIAKFQEETQRLIEAAREELRKIINDFKAKGRTDIHRLEQAIRAKEGEMAAVFSASQGDLPAPVPEKETFARSLATPGDKKGQNQGKKKKISIDFEIPDPVRELNLIGLRVEEALPLVDKTIDEAFLAGSKELTIIHGSGTGRLRKAIRRHLQNHVFVKSFIPGSPGQGGDGVTIVEIGPAPSGSRETGRKGIKPN